MGVGPRAGPRYLGCRSLSLFRFRAQSRSRFRFDLYVRRVRPYFPFLRAALMLADSGKGLGSRRVRPHACSSPWGGGCLYRCWCGEVVCNLLWVACERCAVLQCGTSVACQDLCRCCDPAAVALFTGLDEWSFGPGRHPF
jgi:hypothetical protein